MQRRSRRRHRRCRRARDGVACRRFLGSVLGHTGADHHRRGVGHRCLHDRRSGAFDDLDVHDVHDNVDQQHHLDDLDHLHNQHDHNDDGAAAAGARRGVHRGRRTG